MPTTKLNTCKVVIIITTLITTHLNLDILFLIVLIICCSSATRISQSIYKNKETPYPGLGKLMRIRKKLLSIKIL